MAIVEGLAVKNEVMLDGFSNVIAPDDMDCKDKHRLMFDIFSQIDK